MRLRYLTYAGGLAALTVAAVVLSRGMGVDLSATEAEAVTQTSTLTLNCTTPTTAAFTPSVTYALSFPAAVVSAATTPGQAIITATLTGNINADTAPAMTAVAGSGSSHLTMYSAAPKIKVGGLQCSASTQSQLQAYGTNNSTTYDTALEVVGATTYNASNKIDGVLVGAPLMEFGTAGIGGAALIPDTGDAEGPQNGEIVMGTGATATSGGLRLFGDVTYLGANPNTSAETISLVFTPS